jgi:hypothetical protein
MLTSIVLIAVPSKAIAAIETTTTRVSSRAYSTIEAPVSEVNSRFIGDSPDLAVRAELRADRQTIL